MTITHRLSNTPEYNIWIGIKTRCYNPKSTVFAHYGGRGIVMCDSWRASFETFYADIGPRPSPKHSIERVDNDGPYSPENCRWATDNEQANNMRSNHYITHQGVTQSVADWARQLGIPYNRLRGRIERGLSPEQALASQDITSNRIVHRVTYQGETRPLSEWAKITGVDVALLYDRIVTQEWPIERAMTTTEPFVYLGKLLTHNGETKNISEWAKQIGISTSALSKRLRSGWSVERALTTAPHTEKITRR